jgi:hypothetical protein
VDEFRDVQKSLSLQRKNEIVEGATEISKLLSASNKILNVSRGRGLHSSTSQLNLSPCRQ